MAGFGLEEAHLSRWLDKAPDWVKEQVTDPRILANYAEGRAAVKKLEELRQACRVIEGFVKYH